jgi:hypothetical protein
MGLSTSSASSRNPMDLFSLRERPFLLPQKSPSILHSSKKLELLLRLRFNARQLL